LTSDTVIYYNSNDVSQFGKPLMDAVSAACVPAQPLEQPRKDSPAESVLSAGAPWADLLQLRQHRLGGDEPLEITWDQDFVITGTGPAR
jgi:hypothetical protein